MTVLPRRIKDTLAPASQVRQTSTFAVHRRGGAGYINISEQKSVEPICTLRVPWPPVSACQHVIVNRYLKNPSPRFSHSVHVSSGVLSHRFFVLPPWHSMCHVQIHIQTYSVCRYRGRLIKEHILRGDGVTNQV